MENRKIKIGYIIASSEIGGTEKMLSLLAEKLDKKIFSPIFFCLKGSGRFTERLKEKGFKVYILNIKKNPSEFIKLYFILKKERPDIIHSFLFVGNIIGRIYGKILRIKYIISSQRSVDLWRRWYHNFIDKLTSKLVNIIISNSYAGKEFLIKIGIKKEKIKVIPNGIEIPEKIEKIKKEEIIIGTVGNLRKAKGHIYLIKSAKIVLSRYKNVKFYIVGDGQLKKFLLKKIKQENILENFVLTGYVENVYEYLKIFDIFVLPSLWEGSPVSLIEAMSYAIASIATSVGDVPYIIEDGETGFVVKPKDYKEIAKKIIILIENKNLREIIGIKAREKIINYFSYESMVKSYSEIYLSGNIVIKENKV